MDISQQINDEFSNMNDMQHKAIFCTEGPLLILAGAGSGKTTVLVNRIAYLIKYKGVAPYNILAITFTNKAANELKDRLGSRLSDDASDIWAGTFHSICVRMLRRFSGSVGYESNFTIYDTDDTKRLIKECIKLSGINDSRISPKDVAADISKAKNRLETPDDYETNAGNDYRLRTYAKIYRMYQKSLKDAGAMDFDDLIMNAISMLRNDEQARNYFQNKFRYIHVDEYQDTNHAQYILTSLLAEKYKNICVVGDDDQSIYGFRGATIANILDFEHNYKGAKVIRLEQNYRSTSNILDAANAVISHNKQRKGKKLWTGNGDGTKIHMNISDNESEEAAFIADVIMQDSLKNIPLSDHAVLYRTNAQSSALESVFIRSGIPYRVIGGHRFYERREIKDAIAYLSIINNPDDNIRLTRIINVPKRGIGDSTVRSVAAQADIEGVSIYNVMSRINDYPEFSRSAQKISAFVSVTDSVIKSIDETPLPQLLDDMLRAYGYTQELESAVMKNDAESKDARDRLENLAEFKNTMVRFMEDNEEPSLSAFLEDLALLTDLDSFNSQDDCVVMMTLHSAKGLEFPVVFMTGMEENLFPSSMAQDPSEVEEERRLCYVGITRARSELYLCRAQRRTIYGSPSYNRPSRFLSEIPEELCDGDTFTSTAPSFVSSSERTSYGHYAPSGSGHAAPTQQRGFTAAKKPASKSGRTYRLGDTVIHSSFGTGVITALTPMGNDTMLEIAFDKAGTKKLMANYARLSIPGEET
jgi:DNA helicase-2/ATP-dependent DNA helicase PcrA